MLYFWVLGFAFVVKERTSRLEIASEELESGCNGLAQETECEVLRQFVTFKTMYNFVKKQNLKAFQLRMCKS